MKKKKMDRWMMENYEEKIVRGGKEDEKQNNSGNRLCGEKDRILHPRKSKR